MRTSISSFASFCINLDRRPDRWLDFTTASARIGLDLTRVSAVDRMDGMSGPAACMASHRKVWAASLELKDEFVAIFEDDAMFPSYFEDIFDQAFSELPEDWRVWHLHSFGPGQKLESVGKYVTRLKRLGWGSHGYVIKREFAKDLLELTDHVKNMPVDVLLTTGMRYLGVIPYGVELDHTLCIQSAHDTDIPESTQSKYWSRVRDMYMR